MHTYIRNINSVYWRKLQLLSILGGFSEIGKITSKKSTKNSAIEISRVLRKKNKKGNSDNTYEWCAENAIPQKENLQDVKNEGLLDLWYKAFNNNQGIFIEDLE